MIFQVWYFLNKAGPQSQLSVSLLGEKWGAAWTQDTLHTGIILPGVFEGGSAFTYFVNSEIWTRRRGVIRWLLSTLATCTPTSRRLCCMRNSAQPDRCSPFGYAETWSPGDPWDTLMSTSPSQLMVRNETCKVLFYFFYFLSVLLACGFKRLKACILQTLTMSPYALNVSPETIHMITIRDILAMHKNDWTLNSAGWSDISARQFFRLFGALIWPT